MRTVIVVDDDKDVRESFSLLLSLNNYKVIATGKDGKEAVNLFEKFNPNLIFLDYKMPEYDGLYALEKIKNIDPSSKVIIVTGTIDCHNLFLEKGAYAVFSKTYDVEKMMCTIEKLEVNEVVCESS